METRSESVSLLVLFAVASVLLFYVFVPFLTPLALAAVFAVLLHEANEHLTRVLGGSKNIATTITIILTVILVIVPLSFLAAKIVGEAGVLYTQLSDNSAQFASTLQEAVQAPIRHIAPNFTFDVRTYVGSTLVFISSNVGLLALQTVQVIFQMFLMLLALFFFLRDGRGMVASFIETSPLGKVQTRKILYRMHETISAIMKGTVLNAFIRWFAIWLAFSFFGIPNAVLWSSIGAIIGAIPGLGTPFAFIPAVAYLYLQGNPIGALGVALAGAAIVLIIDNILTAYFFGRSFTVSPIFVLFSILGGVVFFGPLGLILGPLVLSVFLSVVHVYSASEHDA